VPFGPKTSFGSFRQAGRQLFSFPQKPFPQDGQHQ
jgi:hypothetical protein